MGWKIETRQQYANRGSSMVEAFESILTYKKYECKRLKRSSKKKGKVVFSILFSVIVFQDVKPK